MTHQTVDYATRIREQGYRLTPQRELVLDLICACSPHCTLDALLEQAQTADPNLAPSTVYRAVDFLCEVGLVACSHLGGSKVYEVAVGRPDHHHLVCRVCGRDTEIPHTMLNDFIRTVHHQTGFALDLQHLVLEGLCAACQQGGSV